MIRTAFPSGRALRRVFCILALIGAVCAAGLLLRRAYAELRSDRAACAVVYADVQTLAAVSGKSDDAWLDALRAAGVAFLISGGDSDYAAASEAAARAGMGIASARTAHPGDAFFLPQLPETAEPAASALPGDIACLACVEDLARTGLLLPQGTDPDALPCPAVKTLCMFPRYRAFSPDDAPYSEPCNILFRAVTERGMRLLVLAPLECGGKIVGDPAVYTQLLRDLGARLRARGVTLGETFSTLDAPKTERSLLAGALLLLVCAALLLVRLVFPRLPLRLTAAALGICAAFAVLLALLRPTLAMTLGSFAAAVVGGCWGAWILARFWRAEGPYDARAFPGFCAVLLRLLLCGVLTGLYVGALLSCRRYMLGFTVFRGVKAAQALPLLAAAAALILAVRADPGPVLPRGRRRVWSILTAVLLLAAAAALLLLRSGDAGFFVSGLELRVRNWLERICFVRPRSKEMLLAVPAAALFALTKRYRRPLAGIVFGTLAALETVSVINSFCHIVTPLHVTLIRTALGALIGFVIGAVLLLLLEALLRRRPPA